MTCLIVISKELLVQPGTRRKGAGAACIYCKMFVAILKVRSEKAHGALPSLLREERDSNPREPLSNSILRHPVYAEAIVEKSV
jgi:hypothetical protein